MAPSVTETATKIVESVKAEVAPVPEEKQSAPVGSTELEEEPKLEINHKEPLKPSGVLDQYKHFDVTPVLGREFVDVDLAAWLHAPNSDELIRELAITSK